MKNNTKKSEIFIFSTYEYKAIEEYLEEMAQKGWLIESVKGYKFTFTKIEPKKLKYSVELVSQISYLDFPNSNIALEYREYCQAAGWTYACEKGKLQIFYTEDYANTISIHTDENEKYKSIFKSSFYEILLKLLLVCLLYFHLYKVIFTSDISYILSSNLGILSSIVIFILIIINIIEVISFIHWSIKAKLKVKHGHFVPHNTFKQLKRKNLINKIINITIILGILGVLFMSKSEFSILNIIATPSFDTNTSSKTELSLTLDDFKYEFSNNPNDLSIRVNTSIIGRKTDYSAFTKGEEFLSYSLFESNYPWAITAMEKSIINYRNNLRKEYNDDFTIGEPIIVNSIKIYALSNNRCYLLVSNNKVLDIYNCFDNISDEEFLKIVYANIFNKDISITAN